MEAARRKAGEARNEHRHHGAALHISHTDPRLDEGMLEREAAAEEEGHKIVPPEVSDVAPLLGQLALAVDAVARHIGAKICTRRGAGWLWVARWRDLNDRTGRGVAGTEGGELDGRLLRKNDHVGLLIGRAVPGGGPAPFAAARSGSQFGSGRRYSHGIRPLRRPVN